MNICLNLAKNVCSGFGGNPSLVVENSESESEEPALQGELRDEIYDSDHEDEDGDRFAGMYIL